MNVKKPAGPKILFEKRIASKKDFGKKFNLKTLSNKATKLTTCSPYC